MVCMCVCPYICAAITLAYVLRHWQRTKENMLCLSQTEKCVREFHLSQHTSFFLWVASLKAGQVTADIELGPCKGRCESLCPHAVAASAHMLSCFSVCGVVEWLHCLLKEYVLYVEQRTQRKVWLLGSHKAAFCGALTQQSQGDTKQLKIHGGRCGSFCAWWLCRSGSN